MNPYFKENDSILKAGHKDLAKTPVAAAPVKKAEVNLKPAVKKASSTSLKPKENTKPKAVVKPKEKKKTPEKKPATKPKTKAKVKIE